jgi:hypothetical protein
VANETSAKAARFRGVNEPAARYLSDLVAAPLDSGFPAKGDGLARNWLTESLSSYGEQPRSNVAFVWGFLGEVASLARLV